MGVLLLSPLGCMAQVGSTLTVPSDARQTCESHCEELDMRLTAVAVMANNVGCVCGYRDAGASEPTAGQTEAVSGGMVTILLQEEERQRQQSTQSRSLQ